MSLSGLHEWLHKTFSDLVETVSSEKIPYQTFDHVFIDMEHVLSNSARSSSNNEFANLFLSNADVINYCLHYIETLFTLFRPKHLFYIAIPGVEPHAAAVRTRNSAFMTSQRTSLLKDQMKTAKAPPVPLDAFDPNSLHSGSQFMLDLQKNVEYWVVEKINKDKDWQHFDVVVSGQDVPGESKHKIMSHVRQGESVSNDSEFSLAVFSEDAEAILLAAVANLPNIHVLFTDSNLCQVHPEKKSYQTLSVNKLKEKLSLHFEPFFNESSCKIAFDIERFCADFAILCHFAGSKYFPQLPLLFSKNSLDQILDCYKSCVPSMKDYIVNPERKMNFGELHEFCDKLSLLEGRVFEQVIVPQMLKTRNDLVKLKSYSLQDAQLKARKEVYGFVYDHRPFPEDSNVADEFSHYRIGYYKYKLKFNDDSQVWRSGMGLIKTLCWILEATLANVPSWSWYFPFPYCPMISDIQSISESSFRFAPESPLHNLAYLMLVLPKASQHLLPEVLRSNSNVDDKVEIDCMHFEDPKKFIILTPPHDVAEILSRYEENIFKLTSFDRGRNFRGSRKIFRSADFEQPTFPSFLDKAVFPDINPCFVSIKIVPAEKIVINEDAPIESNVPEKNNASQLKLPANDQQSTFVQPPVPSANSENRFVPRNFTPRYGQRHPIPPGMMGSNRNIEQRGHWR